VINGEKDITLDVLADYVEGNLSEEESAQIRKAVESSEATRSEYAWLQLAAADLHVIGESIVRNAPEIDVLDGVMRAVEKADESAKIVERRELRKPRPSFALWGGMALAAALLLVVAGLIFEWGIFSPAKPVVPPVAERQKTPEQPDEPEVAATSPDKGESDRLGTVMQQLARDVADRLGSSAKHVNPSEFLATAAPDMSKVSQDEVVALRQAAITDPQAWARLQRIATLDAETAAKVAADSEVTPDAIVGVAASLPDEEARQWLVTAIGRMDEEKPYARLSLAKTYIPEPVSTTKSAESPTLFDGMSTEDLQAFLGEIAALQEGDSENALLDALRAGALFRLGDVEAALAALESLRGKEFATAYGLEAARSRQQALTAAGMPEDAAQMLSAVLAGSDEYNMLCDVARELLRTGQAYEEQGDANTAQQVYEATQRLGEQVGEGAQLSEEALAGVDIQRMALEELEGLYTSGDLIGDIGRLTNSAVELVHQINSLGEVLESLDQMFLGEGNSSFWRELSEQILELGDLLLFQAMPE